MFNPPRSKRYQSDPEEIERNRVGNEAQKAIDDEALRRAVKMFNLVAEENKMELPEVQRDDLYANRYYLIVCYRSGYSCSYQIYDGATIGGENKGYFMDGQDSNGKSLTYKFFQLPKTVR
jgi:hypothetical protein